MKGRLDGRQQTGGKLDTIGGSTNKIGGQLVVGGRLVGSVYVYYDAAGTQVVSHFARSSTSLSSGSVSGLVRVGALGAGQRTPVFRVDAQPFSRYSWYVRLPGPPGGPWAGIVRCEATGALSAPAKEALGRGASLVGTSTTTGDGGMLPEERQHSRTLVYQCLPSRYGCSAWKSSIAK